MTQLEPTRGSEANTPIPSFTWGQLESVLVSLAKTAPKEKMVRHLLEATRKQAQFLPVEETIRDILCIGFVLMDRDFQPSFIDTP
ncbi:hypothetical protein [Brevundimonas nasdae]